MVGKCSSHLTNTVLQWLGYEGEYFTQRQNFIKMLKRNDIAFTELTQKDKEIEMYPTIKEELALMTNEGAKQNIKFLIMEPNDLKMAIMQLKTKNGHIIRQYYIDLEDLLKMYVEYTLYFNHRESQRKITSLEQMMGDLKLTNEKQMNDLKLTNQRQEQYMRSLGITLEEVKDQNEDLKSNVQEVQRKLNIAVEDRAPLPLSLKKQERFVLIKRNDPDYMPYYTIRVQHEYVGAKLQRTHAQRAWYTNRKIRSQLLLFPDLEILLDFKANPNSKTLYVRIKDKLKAQGVMFEGNNIELNGIITEQELIEEMKVINDSKRDI